MGLEAVEMRNKFLLPRIEPLFSGRRASSLVALLADFPEIMTNTSTIRILMTEKQKQYGKNSSKLDNFE
jgi:hypothetical protein